MAIGEGLTVWELLLEELEEKIHEPKGERIMGLPKDMYCAGDNLGEYTPDVEIRLHDHHLKSVEENKATFLNEYTAFVKSMKIYDSPGHKAGLLGYSLPGLMGEVGELASLFAKQYRDKTMFDEGQIAAECGDILFLLFCVITDAGFDPKEIMDGNRTKLLDRKARGKIPGSGDYR